MGESLPTVMEAMSMATGKSTAEVIKLVSTGKLMTKDVLIPFNNALRVLARRNGALAAGQQKLMANQARMTNTFKELVDKIFQGKGAGGISKVFEVIGRVIEAITPITVEFTDALFSGVSVIGEFVLAFGKLIGITNNSDKQIGALLRGWYHLVAMWYSALEVVSLLNLAMEKLSTWGTPSWVKTAMGAAQSSMLGSSSMYINAAIKQQQAAKPAQPAKPVSSNVTIGDMHFTTSSTDPKQSAIEMTSMISNLITAGR